MIWCAGTVLVPGSSCCSGVPVGREVPWNLPVSLLRCNVAVDNSCSLGEAARGGVPDVGDCMHYIVVVEGEPIVTLSGGWVVLGKVGGLMEDVGLVGDEAVEGAECAIARVVCIVDSVLEPCLAEVVVAVKEVIAKDVDHRGALASVWAEHDWESELAAKGDVEEARFNAVGDGRARCVHHGWAIGVLEDGGHHNLGGLWRGEGAPVRGGSFWPAVSVVVIVWGGVGDGIIISGGASGSCRSVVEASVSSERRRSVSSPEWMRSETAETAV